MMASARDYECPICMMLMIEPVLLPCKHELCYKCFILSYTNTNDQCPFCRVRIATWARKAMKTNRVINTAKWDLIKKLFPEKVKCILEGRDIISDEEETEMQIISEDGSLGKEYMAELEKIESERLLASQEEEAASLALIEKLCQAENPLFALTSGKMDSTSGSSDIQPTLMPNERTYSITDEERLKQVKEEEAASLRFIQQLQQEEVKEIRERHRREELDWQYARMIAATLNKPLPTEPVVDPSDCVICTSSASLSCGFCVDAPSLNLPASGSSSASSDSASTADSSVSAIGATYSKSSASASSAASSSSAASASILPMSPSTSSSFEIPSSITHMSTEDMEKVVTPNSICRKWETNVRGKRSATTTTLTKWLRMSQLPEAALGSISESGMTVLDLPPAMTSLTVGTSQPTQMNTSSTEELATELLRTVSRQNVAEITSLEHNSEEVCPAVAQRDVASCEQTQTVVRPECASAVSVETTQGVLTSEVDQVFGLSILEVGCESNKSCSEVTGKSNSIGMYSDGALSYSGRPIEIPAPDCAMQCCSSQDSDYLPSAFGSRMKEPKQQGVEHSATGQTIPNIAGMVAKTPPSGSLSRKLVVSGRKNNRSHSSAVGTSAKKSLKRSMVYLNEDPVPCCSTSGLSQTACRSSSLDCSCSIEKKMCLDWLEMSMLNPNVSEESEAVPGTSALTRNDFNSDESYRLYLEEQDYQLALRLQRTFDLESRPKKVRRSAESAR